MKLFVQKLILFGVLFGVAFLLYTSLVIISFLSDREAYIMAFPVKQQILADRHRQNASPVVLLGGSNVAYGFNSELLQDSLNRPAVNLGLGAGSGLKFMLDHTSRRLVKGDLLVIAPEYHHFFNEDAHGNTDLACMFYLDPSVSRDFDAKQWKAFVFGSKNLLKEYLLSVLKITRKKTEFKVSDFNRCGDLTAHWTLPPRSYGHVSPGEFGRINLAFLDYYKNTVETLRNQGIEIVIIPPPFSETSYRNTEESLLPLFAEFEKRNLTFSIPPQESTYADSLFFDSHYHLGYEGVMMRTDRLMRLLKNR